MNDEQEIERIVKVLEKATQPIEYDENCCTITTYPTERDIAESLVDAGIGDKKQAVKEFKNKFWDKICIELNDILGQNSSLRIEIKQYIEYVLREFFTELYGADE